jgi:hypothetical protein
LYQANLKYKLEIPVFNKQTNILVVFDKEQNAMFIQQQSLQLKNQGLSMQGTAVLN